MRESMYVGDALRRSRPVGALVLVAATLALAACSRSDGIGPSLSRDVTPTSRSSGPQTTTDSPALGSGGGPGAGDAIGSGGGIAGSGGAAP